MLTRDEIYAMTDNEIRKAIAVEKGMRVLYEYGNFWEIDDQRSWGNHRVALLKNCPTDMNDAMILVDEINNSGTGLVDLCFKSGVNPDDWNKLQWVCEIRLFSDMTISTKTQYIISYAQTAPRAICEAWLMWKQERMNNGNNLG